MGILNNSPKAIWGDKSDSADGTLIANTLTGFRWIPAKPPKAGVTHSVNRNTLAWELDVYAHAFQPATLSPFKGTQNTSVDKYIEGTDKARQTVLNAMGLQNSAPNATELAEHLKFGFVPTIITGTFGEQES